LERRSRKSAPRGAFGAAYALAVLGLSLLVPRAAQAFNTLDGDRTAWPADPSYRITNRSADVRDGSDAVAIRRSFTTWQDVPTADIAFREVARGGDITVSFLAQWPREFGPDAAGVTITQRARGVISSAEVSINEANFDWATSGDPLKTDIEGVVTHEVGHALGLGHSRVRAATMYWSGGDLELRTLDPDDARGLTFLYGNGAGQGRLCDQCEANADCVNGGVCLTLNDGRMACGTPCGRGNTCEAGASCFELRSGGTQCAPDALFCADDGGPGQIAEGDYCWGADQCAQGSQCVPIPDGSAVCARTCVNDRGCPAGSACLGADAGQGLCIPRGQAAFGAVCSNSLECASLLCVPLDDVTSVCTAACAPAAANPGCPGGAECIAVQDAGDIQGLCIPPGDVAEGGTCGSAADRCADGLTCIVETTGAEPVCRAACAPFGACGRGRGCTPYSANDWFCLPLIGGDVGEACDPDAVSCQGGLFCMPTVSAGSGQCVRVCRDTDAAACGGAGCFDIDGADGNLGICSPGSGRFADACETGADCASFQCVADGEGGVCSQRCDRTSPCPNGFDCRALRTGEQLCFRSEGAPSAGGEPNAGGGSNAGGDPNAGGGSSAGGDPNAGGEPNSGPGGPSAGGTGGMGEANPQSANDAGAPAVGAERQSSPATGCSARPAPASRGGALVVVALALCIRHRRRRRTQEVR